MPPTYVQSANVDTLISQTTCVVTLVGTVAGNLLIAAFGLNSSNDIVTSVNGSVNGDYTRATWIGGTSTGIHVYYKENGAGGTEVLTVTLSVIKTINCALLEYSGMATAGALDQADGRQQPGAGNTSTDGDVGPTVITTTNGQLIFGNILDTNGSSTVFTAGTGYTGREAGLAGASYRNATEDKVQTSAGSVQTTWTADGTSNYLATIATFKAAAASGPTAAQLIPAFTQTGGSYGVQYV